MRSAITCFLLAIFTASLLAAQATNPSSDDPSKAAKSPPADDGKQAQPPAANSRPQRGDAPPQRGADRGFRGPGNTIIAPPGARGGFVPPPPTTTSRTVEPADRPGLGLPRTMPPLPPGTAAGKSLLLDVCLAQTATALDQPSPAEIFQLERDGKLASTARVRLLFLENIPSFAQFGELANKVSGSTATNTRVLPIYSAVNVGTMVQATGRVDDDGTILLQVYIEKSALAPSSEPPDIRAPESITRMLTQSTVRLKPGEPAVLSGGPATSAKSQDWIVITCRTLP